MIRTVGTGRWSLRLHPSDGGVVKLQLQYSQHHLNRVSRKRWIFSKRRKRFDLDLESKQFIHSHYQSLGNTEKAPEWLQKANSLPTNTAEDIQTQKEVSELLEKLSKNNSPLLFEKILK